MIGLQPTEDWLMVSDVGNLPNISGVTTKKIIVDITGYQNIYFDGLWVYMCFRFSPFRVLTKATVLGASDHHAVSIFFRRKMGVWPLFAAIDTFKKTTINTYKKKTNKNWFELPNLRQTQILWKRGEWMCMMWSE